jgi:c-di-AMP phosphodiesterase-like protein
MILNRCRPLAAEGERQMGKKHLKIIILLTYISRLATIFVHVNHSRFMQKIFSILLILLITTGFVAELVVAHVATDNYSVCLEEKQEEKQSKEKEDKISVIKFYWAASSTNFNVMPNITSTKLLLPSGHFSLPENPPDVI